ncbi:hypothetical protein KIS1582_4932 [Cytobacillus firmus]|uniref:Uncharacterized protein n=1 Tax=Cytobacillus firmus TaxID=1399 RepID=A0A800N811_CYTFI|nr:hypothetical protein KIS1582_4932 [Cytobacillus firmus]
MGKIIEAKIGDAVKILSLQKLHIEVKQNFMEILI